MTRTRLRSATVLLACLVLVAAGGSAAALLLPEPTPAGAERVEPPRAWPATATSFADERTVQATPVMTEGTVVAVETAGTVTALSCAPGTPVVSGSSPVTVDDRPLVALATRVPLWRDLGTGATGTDVVALQDELNRLGYAAGSDGRFGRATRAAVAALLESVGVPDAPGELARGSVVWLPEPEVAVARCPLRVGATVGPGSALAESGPALTSLRFVAPADVVDGDRVVSVAGASAAVGPGQPGGVVQVVDEPLLGAVAASPELALALSGATGSATVPLRYALAAPLDLLSVPPAALAGLSGAGACLVVDGAAVPVTVVASSLGATMVRLPAGAASAPATVDAPPAGTTC